MRILLVAPKNNYYEPMPRINIFGQGLPYIAGALKKAGHEVFGINMSYQWCGLSPKQKLEQLIRDAVKNYEPELIGIGGISADYAFIRDAIQLSRKYANKTPILIGGGIVTYDRDYIFQSLSPDFALTGEAEQTTVQLLEYLNGERKIDKVENLAYWSEFQGMQVPVLRDAVAQNDDLDAIPYPDYDVFDYKMLQEQFTQTDLFYGYVNRKPRVLPLSGARSCPMNCTFCLGHSLRPPYRLRTIDSIIKEIEYFHEKYEFNLLFLYEELFSVKPERITEFCQKVIELKERKHMDFVWTCDLRVDNIDKVPLKLMKESGCAFIGYGIESGSQRVLNSMNKKITVEQIAHTIDLTTKAGIGMQGNLILGDPAETLETIRESIDFKNKYCRDMMISMGHIIPYPGSEIFEYCFKNGIIKDKKSYYEKSNQYPLVAQFNMTKMPDKLWYDTIYRIEERRDTRVLPDKEGMVMSCVATGEMADPALPDKLRRPLYNIVVNCPHCHRNITYLAPLGKERVPIRTTCMECAKYFMFKPPEIKLLAWRRFESKVLGYLPPSLRLNIVNRYWGFRHWLVYVRNRGEN